MGTPRSEVSCTKAIISGFVHNNKKGDLTGWSNPLSAVRTRLELATPGVTGRYSKPTELPHQLSVNSRSCRSGLQRYNLILILQIFRKIFTKKCPAVGSDILLLGAGKVYRTSICLRTFSGSIFLTFAMVTVRTPCSTLAAMSSRFASSGRSIVCWNLV